MNFSQRLINAIQEDCPTQDLTSLWFTAGNHPSVATLTAKDSGIFFGETLISTLLNLMDPNATVKMHTQDSTPINNQEVLCTLHSTSHTLLKIERVLLNLLQKGCGIATLTHRFVQTLNNPNIHILDTRKTTPLWRDFERDAVRAGGGYNHRFCLSDMVLIKENHLAELEKAGELHTLKDRMNRLKAQNPTLKIEIEIETLNQLQNWDLSQADIIMLDHFSLPDLHKAAAICLQKNYTAQLEVSGNITLDSIAQFRNVPIHRISIGALTHSAPALDLSMRIMV